MKKLPQLITEESTLTDVSAYLSVLPIHKALKEVGAMKYQPKHTSALITQLNEDLPDLIKCVYLMEIRLKKYEQILRTKNDADKIIDKFISENPDWKIELTNG